MSLSSYESKYGNLRIDNKGYYEVSSRKKGYHKKSLHRLIWEDHYGKAVPKDYFIHHINENRKDNRIQNLQCVHKTVHNRHHFSSKKHIDRIIEVAIKKRKFPKTIEAVGARLNKNVSSEKKCWYSQICHCQKIKSLGYFEDFVSASIVYKLVANEIREY